MRKWIFMLVGVSVFVFNLIFMPHAMSQEMPQRRGAMSLIGFYSKSTYGEQVYSTTRRYTAAISANLTAVTELELAFINQDYFFKQAAIQTVKINEKTLSLSLIQTLVPVDWVFQPYVKGGAAQYNRKQNSTLYGIPTPEVYTKSPSFLLG